MQSHRFIAGDFQSKGWSWDVPEDFFGITTYFVLKARVKITAAYSGGQDTDTVLVWGVSPKNPSAAITYTDIDKSFSSSDPITTDRWKEVKWVIPSSAFVGKEGGKIACWLHVLSTSTGPHLDVGEVKGRFEIEEPEPASGFYFVS